MMKTAKAIAILFSFAFLLPANSCDVVQQAQHASNLFSCDFRINNVQNVSLAGVSIQHVQKYSSLNMGDAARIMAAAAGGSLPLAFLLNIEGKNPNASPAGMNKLDWILFIDDIQMTTGTLNNRFTIPPNNGTTNIPVTMSMDLKQVLRGKSVDAIINFAFNLAGAGNRPTRITAKIKPTIMIGQNTLPYPGYITINTNYSGIH